jgi:signal transduction histidine kinase
VEAGYPEREPEVWGEDSKLVAVLGEQGAREFRALFDAFPEAVGVLWALRDDDGAIRDFAFGYGNPTMLRRSGLPPSTADRLTLLEALPRIRGSRAFDAYVRVCDSGEPWVTEVVYDTPFGEGYMLGTFVHRAARLGDGLVVFLHDVTDERRMENELRGYAHLVAHDLSEPLAGIALLVTVLEQAGDEPPDPQVLRELRATADRARQLIDGVLLYADSGELRVADVALQQVVEDVAEDLRHRLAQEEATLNVGTLPDVRADPRQVRRVLQNLVHNALKFRGPEPPLIEISAAVENEEWVLTVRDNGIGVGAEHASRVFDMFNRVDREAEGVGIGLAVCRRIVEAHGGRIWVEPNPGAGSAFRFTLPYEAQGQAGSTAIDAASSTK